MKFVQSNSTANTTSCARIPRYIVIHYTAGTNSKPGTALNIAKMFANPATKASADYIVDDEYVVQYNADPMKRYCWSVGGTKYSRKYNSQSATLYGTATNANCVNIELCSNKKNTKTLNAEDKDWYFTDATLNNAIELTKNLMILYKIPIDNVIMHNHVTGKLCPSQWSINDAALAQWNTFKNKVYSAFVLQQQPTAAPQQTTNTTTNTSYMVRILVDGLNIRKGPSTSYAVVGQVKKNIVYTIVEEINGWGKLKSGAGYISLNSKYVKKI